MNDDVYNRRSFRNQETIELFVFTTLQSLFLAWPWGINEQKSKYIKIKIPSVYSNIIVYSRNDYLAGLIGKP